MQEQATLTLPEQTARGAYVLPMRLVTALFQAAVLYVLINGSTSKDAWQVAHPGLFSPLLLVFVYTPLIIMVGLGQMRGRTLAVWACVVALVCAGLGYHDIARGRAVDYIGQDIVWPRFTLFLAIAATLFTAHVLVVDGTAERRLFPSYKRHFDTAWKLGMQIALSVVFVGMFWILLMLGGTLFKLLGLRGFANIIGSAWFADPATTLALATALHLTDVRPVMIQSVRAIALTLFSWLLPLLTAIVAAFLCSLPFTSLEPLWRTNFATTLLLATVAALVFLINSSYQDGSPEHTASRVKRLAATVGAILLLPLCGLAIWALYLRVAQYGWTESRIFGAAAIAIATCYAIGYAIATLRSPAWFKRLEVTNVATAYLAIVMMLAIFSPVADPGRLMVASQVERLRSGAVAADKFDFVSLKYDGARWGIAALKVLVHQQDGADAKTIRGNAERALASTSRSQSAETQPVTHDTLAAHIKFLTPDRTLPAEFYDPEFWAGQSRVLSCLKGGIDPCTASYIALSPGEPDAILFADTYEGMIFVQDKRGHWQRTAKLESAVYCPNTDIRQAMQNGTVTTAAHPWQDIVVNGIRFTVMPYKERCPDGYTRE